MREHGHSEIVGDFDEKYMLILTDRNEGRFTYILEDGGSQDLPAGFDLLFWTQVTRQPWVPKQS
jgi:hypothetical protein